MTRERKPIDVDNLVRLYTAGHSRADCGRILGIPSASVSAGLKRAGFPADKVRNQAIDIDRAIRLYDSGMTCQQIAPLFNTSEATIRRRLIAHGVTIRQGPSYRKGARDSDRTLRLRSVANFANPTHIGPREVHFASLLDDMGVRYGQQTIIGHYNVDFALDELPVVVEIQAGGGNYRTRATKFDRFKFILDSGWHIIEVKIHTQPRVLTAYCAEQVVAEANRLSSDPSASRQYRVFGGDGHRVALRGANRDRWASIGAL